MKNEEITLNGLKTKIDDNFNILNNKIDENFVTLNTKIDDNFSVLNTKIDGAVMTLLSSMDAHFKEIKTSAEVKVEMKNDDMRIYNDRYNKVDQENKILGLKIDDLDLRVSELERV